MKAEEMFKELGFEKEVTNSYITFNKIEKNPNYNKEIIFSLLGKYFLASDGSCDPSAIGIDMRLYKAINQQLKELGWL